MRLRSAMGSSMPSSQSPSIAIRTPRTWPAQRWPCATSASFRYSSSVFTGPSMRANLFESGALGRRYFLRRAPGMRLASLDEYEPSHQDRENRHGGVFQNFFQADRLGSGEAAAVDVHVQQISAQYDESEPDHDYGENGRPDAEAPADQQHGAEKNFREGQRMCDELHAPRRQHLECIDLECEIRDVGGYRKFQEEPGPEMRVGQESFGVAGVDKDGAKDETADPDDRAPKVQWTGLHHLLGSVRLTRCAAFVFVRRLLAACYLLRS